MSSSDMTRAQVSWQLPHTGNDRYSGHGYNGIDRFSGTKPLTTQFYLLLVESPL